MLHEHCLQRNEGIRGMEMHENVYRCISSWKVWWAEDKTECIFCEMDVGDEQEANMFTFTRGNCCFNAHIGEWKHPTTDHEVVNSNPTADLESFAFVFVWKFGHSSNSCLYFRLLFPLINNLASCLSPASIPQKLRLVSSSVRRTFYNNKIHHVMRFHLSIASFPC